MFEMYVGSLYNKNISQIPQNYLLQVVKEQEIYAILKGNYFY